MSTRPGIHILIAEDNPGDIYLLKETFQKHEIECDVSVALDGAQALNLIEQIECDSQTHCPDLFLVDLHLPKADGEDILRRLRASERCGHMAVIVMSTSDAPADHAVAERYAAERYFRKPPDLNDFMEIGRIVRNLIEQRSGHLVHS